MSFVVLRNKRTGRWVPGFAVVLALVWGGCVLDFPIEWLEGECGDGYVDQGEQCDDNDTNSGDGCSATCEEEPGFDCQGEPSVCISSCGNGEIQEPEENCDDNNDTSGDGCSSLCRLEDGWVCNGVPSICSSICGDGTVVGDEALMGGCDDGNTVSNDGCDFQCQVEPGWVCNGEPSVCQDICGDGTVVVGLEECDDGNMFSNDGCGASCQVEDGFTCDGASPTVCTAICGDGTVVGAEAQAGGCDDGNTDPNDGCAADCTEETGYSCSGEPSTCTAICGDSIVIAGIEICDDGNTSSCDGCRGDCLAYETGCGDGAICGTEACDDGNNGDGDGCSSACAEEAGWSCGGEPSVCTVPCTRPEALYLQMGCSVGDMCTMTSYSGGSYTCVAEGADAYYQSCAGYQTCQAGLACDNLGFGQMCYPYCRIGDPTWTCPMNGGDFAICLYYWPESQLISGICVPNECDVVAQTGCSTGWCNRITNGVALCETDPPGTVTLGNICVQDSPTSPSEMCLPGLMCIFTGINDECLEYCRLGQSDCTTPQSCVTWNPPDPVYGICN